MSTIPAASRQPDDVVIDFVHLARQTAGDQELELELLDMFARRSAELLERIARANGVESRLDIAHGLRGSALAIGARRVVRAAANYESLAQRASEDASLAAAFEKLADAVTEARGTIAAVR